MANVHQNFSSRQDFGSYCHQISVFKVQINCCKDCPKKLKTKLLNLNGVGSVEVDERQNKVTVKGTIDSREIIKKLENWGKKTELVHERKETNPNVYTVQLIDDDEGEEKDLPNDSFRHKDSSFRHKDSSFRHKDSSFRHRNTSDRRNDSSFRARDRGGCSQEPEKYENSESNANSGKEYPDHICRDKYCTYHKRDNSTPEVNNDDTVPPIIHGGLNFNHPVMKSFVPPPYMSPPPPIPYYGQYYDPLMMPPAAAYGYFRNGHRQGCSIM